METATDRYEIFRQSQPESSPQYLELPNSQGNHYLYTFSRVLNAWEVDNEFYAQPETKVPLELKYKEVIGEDLDWHDFVWGDSQMRLVKNISTNENERTEKTVGIYGPLINFKLYDVKN